MKRLEYLCSVLFTLAALFIVTGCNEPVKDLASESSVFTHPEWAKNANIYEVNIRQYTQEGTFNAFREHLPRLEKMGVEILWLMPIHPIGEKNRKGTLGSYYAVKDYKGINPAFGTLKDFKSLVKEAHQRDMKVILDWVANHTAWDHPWTQKHPEWYTKNEEGNFKPPVKDWSDVIELDYTKEGLRQEMTEAMKYWVDEANIDGYRCDVAGMVPMDFWVNVRKELDQIKPVFMLAEDNSPNMHKAFDMTYGWDFHFLMNEVATGDTSASSLGKQLKREKEKFNADDYRMQFTSNHDENSWKGTVKERMGANAKNFAVMAATIGGMPLIYSGQEAGLDKRLEFFEKDPINWEKLPLESFYTTLLKLKKTNKALWNGSSGGQLIRLSTSKAQDIFAFKRVRGEHEVLVILNLSDKSQPVEFSGLEEITTYTNVFEPHESMDIPNKNLTVGAHKFLVLQK